MLRSLSSGLPPDLGLSDTLMPMWWNENDGIDTALTFTAPASPSQIVGGISGQMSTAPVRSDCAITSSFWKRIQEIFFAAGAGPHQVWFLVISIDWPLIQLVKR